MSFVLNAATSLLRSGNGPDSVDGVLICRSMGLDVRGSGSVLRSVRGARRFVLFRLSGGAPLGVLRFREDCDRKRLRVLLRNRWGVVFVGTGGLEGGVTAEPSPWPGDATTMLCGC